MNNQDYSRRDFHRLAAAAFGGVVAGSLVGCGKGETPAKTGDQPAATAETPATKPGEASVAKAELHGCRGLNSCKTEKNECAGKSTCATVQHECAGQNDCKYLGGCGKNPGANDCKGMGGCAVPMTHGDAWERARKAFEERMKTAGKPFGEPPAAPEKKES